MRAFFARLFAALAHALRRLRVGASVGWDFITDAIEEAFEPVVSRLPAIQEWAADVGHGADKRRTRTPS